MANSRKDIWGIKAVGNYEFNFDIMPISIKLNYFYHLILNNIANEFFEDAYILASNLLSYFSFRNKSFQAAAATFHHMPSLECLRSIELKIEEDNIGYSILKLNISHEKMAEGKEARQFPLNDLSPSYLNNFVIRIVFLYGLLEHSLKIREIENVHNSLFKFTQAHLGTIHQIKLKEKCKNFHELTTIMFPNASSITEENIVRFARMEAMMVLFSAEYCDPCNMLLPALRQKNYPFPEDLKIKNDACENAPYHIYLMYRDGVQYLGKLWEKFSEDKTRRMEYLKATYLMLNLIIDKMRKGEFKDELKKHEEYIITLILEIEEEILTLIEKLINVFENEESYKKPVIQHQELMTHSSLLDLFKEFSLAKKYAKRIKSNNPKDDVAINKRIVKRYSKSAQYFVKSCPRMALRYVKEAIKISRLIPNFTQETSTFASALFYLYHSLGLESKASEAAEEYIRLKNGGLDPRAKQAIAFHQAIRQYELECMGGDLFGERDQINQLVYKFQEIFIKSHLFSKSAPAYAQSVLAVLLQMVTSFLDKSFNKLVVDKIDSNNLTKKGFIKRKSPLYFPYFDRKDKFRSYLIANGLLVEPNIFTHHDFETQFASNPIAELHSLSKNQAQFKLLKSLLAKMKKISTYELSALELSDEEFDILIKWYPFFPVLDKLLNEKNKIDSDDFTITNIKKSLAKLNLNFYADQSFKEFKSELEEALIKRDIIIYIANFTSEIRSIDKWKENELFFEKLNYFIKKVDSSTIREKTTELENALLNDLEKELCVIGPPTDTNKNDYETLYKKYLPYKSEIKNIQSSIKNPIKLEQWVNLVGVEIKKIKPKLFDLLIKNKIFKQSVNLDDIDSKLLTLEPKFIVGENLSTLKSFLISNASNNHFDFVSRSSNLQHQLFIDYPLKTDSILKKLARHGWIKLTEVEGVFLCALTREYNPNNVDFLKKFNDVFHVKTDSDETSFNMAPLVLLLIKKALQHRQAFVSISDLPAFTVIEKMQPYNAATESSAITWNTVNELANFIKHSGPLHNKDLSMSALLLNRFNHTVSLIPLRPDYKPHDVIILLKNRLAGLSIYLSDEQLFKMAINICKMLKIKYLKQVEAKEDANIKYYLVANDELYKVGNKSSYQNSTEYNIFKNDIGNEIKGIVSEQELSTILNPIANCVFWFLYRRKAQELGRFDQPDLHVNIESIMKNIQLMVSKINQQSFLQEASAPVFANFANNDVSFQSTAPSKAKHKKPHDTLARMIKSSTADDHRTTYYTVNEWIKQIIASGDIKTAIELYIDAGNKFVSTYPPLAYAFYNRTQSYFDYAASKYDKISGEFHLGHESHHFRNVTHKLLYDHHVNFKFLSLLDRVPVFSELDPHEICVISSNSLSNESHLNSNSFLSNDIAKNFPQLSSDFERCWYQIFHLFNKTALLEINDRHPRTMDSIVDLYTQSHIIAKSLRVLLVNIYIKFLMGIRPGTYEARFPFSPDEKEFKKYVNNDIAWDSIPVSVQAALLSVQPFSNNTQWNVWGNNCLAILVQLTNKAKHIPQDIPTIPELTEWRRQFVNHLNSQFFIRFNLDNKTQFVPAAPYLYKTLQCIAGLMNALLSKEPAPQHRPLSWTDMPVNRPVMKRKASVSVLPQSFFADKSAPVGNDSMTGLRKRV